MTGWSLLDHTWCTPRQNVGVKRLCNYTLQGTISPELSVNIPIHSKKEKWRTPWFVNIMVGYITYQVFYVWYWRIELSESQHLLISWAERQKNTIFIILVPYRQAEKSLQVNKIISTKSISFVQKKASMTQFWSIAYYGQLIHPKVITISTITGDSSRQ